MLHRGVMATRKITASQEAILSSIRDGLKLPTRFSSKSLDSLLHWRFVERDQKAASGYVLSPSGTEVLVKKVFSPSGIDADMSVPIGRPRSEDPDAKVDTPYRLRVSAGFNREIKEFARANRVTVTELFRLAIDNFFLNGELPDTVILENDSLESVGQTNVLLLMTKSQKEQVDNWTANNAAISMAAFFRAAVRIYMNSLSKGNKKRSGELVYKTRDVIVPAESVVDASGFLKMMGCTLPMFEKMFHEGLLPKREVVSSHGGTFWLRSQINDFLTAPKPPRRSVDRIKCGDLYKAGKKPSEIARELGKDLGLISRWIKQDFKS